MPEDSVRPGILRSGRGGRRRPHRFPGRSGRVPSLRCAEAPAQDVRAEAYRARGYGVDRWKIELADIDERVDPASTLAVTQTLALFIAGWCGLEKIAK